MSFFIELHFIYLLYFIFMLTYRRIPIYFP